MFLVQVLLVEHGGGRAASDTGPGLPTPHAHARAARRAHPARARSALQVAVPSAVLGLGTNGELVAKPAAAEGSVTGASDLSGPQVTRWRLYLIQVRATCGIGPPPQRVDGEDVLSSDGMNCRGTAISPLATCAAAAHPAAASSPNAPAGKRQGLPVKQRLAMMLWHLGPQGPVRRPACLAVPPTNTCRVCCREPLACRRSFASSAPCAWCWRAGCSCRQMASPTW